MLKLTSEQADSLFTEVRGCNLSEESKYLVISGLQSLFWITSAYQEKKHQLFRFMIKIFGAKTEKTNQKNKSTINTSQKGKEATTNADLVSNMNAQGIESIINPPSEVNICGMREPDK